MSETANSENRRRVLIIDDSSVARAAIRRQLPNEDYEVFERESPIGATVEILKNSIQLVVLDMNMPAMSGERFAHMMRNNPRFADLMIVLVSSESEDQLRRVGKSIQADAVLSKSAVDERLLTTISRLFDVTATHSTMQKVLVVDDDPLVLRATVSRLQSAGFLVESVDTGYGILEQVARLEPDLILLDVVMRGLSGANVAELLLENDWSPKRLILFSADDASELSAQLDALGSIRKSADRLEFVAEFARLASQAQ
ncbi:MAG: response regulator [Myxococcota bacterium]